MPKAVIYTPYNLGGIGFQHLHTKQGMQQVIQTLKHLHVFTTLGKTMQLAIDSYQITMPGITEHILQDTSPLPWMPERWISYLWQFLHQINGKIILKSPWLIPKL